MSDNIYVFCEVCGNQAKGPIHWKLNDTDVSQDLLVCDKCAKDFLELKTKKHLSLARISTVALASVLMVSLGVNWYVDTMPLVDGITALTTLVSGAGLALKSMSIMRR